MTTDARRRDEVVQEGDQSIVGQALKYLPFEKWNKWKGAHPGQRMTVNTYFYISLQP